MTVKSNFIRRISQNAKAYSTCMSRLDEIEATLRPKITAKAKHKSRGVKNGTRQRQ